MQGPSVDGRMHQGRNVSFRLLRTCLPALGWAALYHKETSAARQKGPLFDDLIGRGLQDRRNSQAKRLGGLEIDH
jgi:hypothetical protein